MSILDKAVDIADLGQRKLVVLYGKSNSGKTVTGATFPKPMLYVRVGDDGSNSISEEEGIKALPVENIEGLKNVLEELIKKKGAGYESVFVDTFSMVTNVWIQENAVKKNKRMTQQMWGDIKTESEELVRLAHQLAGECWVILTCHESTDAFEGMEDEILPDIRPSVSKGTRTYLEGLANYGIHCTRVSRTVITADGEKELVRYAAHVGPNPYYWTKLQIPKDRKVPRLMINPSYEKLMKVVRGGE
jgi:hypothetical protein